MTKRDLVVRIFEETGLIQQDVYAVIQKTLDYIVDALAQGETIEFRNFDSTTVHADMVAFLQELKRVNPACKVILTVSPVPLIATYSENDALTATTYSKSVLRAVAGELESAYGFVHYFPSFEIITATTAAAPISNPTCVGCGPRAWRSSGRPPCAWRSAAPGWLWPRRGDGRPGVRTSSF